MSYVGKVSAANSDHFVASTAYGTCGTAAGTAAKIVVMDDFDTLLTGVTIHVLFQNSNTAESPTLNVNNTGAKAIYINGIVAPGDTAVDSWDANSVVSFTYDGEAWRMNDAAASVREYFDLFAKKSITRQVTATAAGWSSATQPTQTIPVSGVLSDNNIIVGLPETITSTQYDIACDGKLVCTAQATNSITMTCYGYKPSIDIPLSVVILG